MDTKYDDKTYSRGERAFLLFAGGFACLVFSVFALGFVYFGFFYHGPYHKTTPWYRALTPVAVFIGFAVISARLVVEAYHGKVLD